MNEMIWIPGSAEDETSTNNHHHNDVSRNPDRWCISYRQLLDVHDHAARLFGEDYPEITMRDVCRDILFLNAKPPASHTH